MEKQREKAFTDLVYAVQAIVNICGGKPEIHFGKKYGGQLLRAYKNASKKAHARLTPNQNSERT